MGTQFLICRIVHFTNLCLDEIWNNVTRVFISCKHISPESPTKNSEEGRSLLFCYAPLRDVPGHKLLYGRSRMKTVSRPQRPSVCTSHETRRRRRLHVKKSPGATSTQMRQCSYRDRNHEFHSGMVVWLLSPHRS
jgi:hypothetical protein